MEYAIFGIVFGLCLFLLPVWAYRRGIQDGINLSRGKPVEPFKGPVKAVQEYREAKETEKKNDELLEGLKNIFAYEGTPQKAVDK